MLLIALNISVSYAQKGWINLIENTVKKHYSVKYFFIYVIYLIDGKAEFFNVIWSFRNQYADLFHIFLEAMIHFHS